MKPHDYLLNPTTGATVQLHVDLEAIGHGPEWLIIAVSPWPRVGEVFRRVSKREAARWNVVDPGVVEAGIRRARGVRRGDLIPRHR